jgi:NADH:ubiquinone oxidoreductase subunit 6 (subunit J)
VAHAVIGWALCGAIVAIGFAVTTVQAALIAHAVGAPIIFALVSANYFRSFGFTTSLQTAIAFVGTVMFLDFFVVSLLINRNLEMFASILGTWLVFALIFVSTYLTGRFISTRSKAKAQVIV